MTEGSATTSTSFSVFTVMSTGAEGALDGAEETFAPGDGTVGGDALDTGEEDTRGTGGGALGTGTIARGSRGGLEGTCGATDRDAGTDRGGGMDVALRITALACTS